MKIRILNRRTVNQFRAYNGRVDRKRTSPQPMLELAKAVSFLVCILSLYWAAMSAFFLPGAQWEERLWIAGFKLLAAAAICFYSGMVFSWPSRTNPTAFQRLTSTLPVRLFFWAVAGIAVLFTLSWYLADSEAQMLSLRGFGQTF